MKQGDLMHAVDCCSCKETAKDYKPGDVCKVCGKPITLEKLLPNTKFDDEYFKELENYYSDYWKPI